MNIKKLPLDKRLHRLAHDMPAHPEHTMSIIQRFAALKFTSYMTGCESELEQLLALLGLAPEEADAMTYADVAASIGKLYTSQSHADAVRATVLLAAPLTRPYRPQPPVGVDDFMEVGEDE